MVTTIQIDERTKALLDKIKVNYRQSYNEVIATMAQEKAKKRDIMEFAGAWKDISERDLDGMKEEISNLRKRATRDLLDNPK